LDYQIYYISNSNRLKLT